MTDWWIQSDGNGVRMLGKIFGVDSEDSIARLSTDMTMHGSSKSSALARNSSAHSSVTGMVGQSMLMLKSGIEITLWTESREAL